MKLRQIEDKLATALGERTLPGGPGFAHFPLRWTYTSRFPAKAVVDLAPGLALVDPTL